MESIFISRERKLSGIKDTGIQYIPGHLETFVDLIIEKYLPNPEGPVLDLGGGGLRFAIPMASLDKKITVVDLDESSVNIDFIFSRMIENGFSKHIDINILKKNILPIVDDIFQFLEKTRIRYYLITAFRLIHFFNENEVDRFFGVISKRLKKECLLVISAFSKFSERDSEYNEIFTNSEPIDGNVFYRKFFENETAKNIQKQQNLGPFVHLFSEEYLVEYGKRYNFKLIAGNLPSTRIVRGYIFSK